MSALMSVLPRITLLTVLTMASGAAICAQESLPDTTKPDTQAAEADQSDRIVDGRPGLYSVKRTAHPLSWLEFAFKPAFRSAEDGWIHRLMIRKPDTDKVSGVKFGVGSAGTSSGFGPSVTFFHKDFLGRSIDVEIPLVYTYSQYQVYQFNASMPTGS